MVENEQTEGVSASGQPIETNRPRARPPAVNRLRPSARRRKPGRRDGGAGSASATNCTIGCCERRAEFDNYRKRVEKERRELSEWAAADVLTDVLAVLDDFDRALSAEAPPEAQGYRAGVELIHRQLGEAAAQARRHADRDAGHRLRSAPASGRGLRGIARRARGRSGRRAAQGLSSRRAPAAARHGSRGQSIVSKRDYYAVLGVRPRRQRSGHQERLSQAGAQVPPRSQPRRQVGRGAVQGSGRGVCGARRRRQARALRSLRPRRGRRASARRGRVRPDDLRRVRRHLRQPRRHLRLRRDVRQPPPRRAAARRRPPLRPRDHVRAVGQRHRDDHSDSATGNAARPVTARARRRAPSPTHVSAVPRHRSAALSAGLLHRRAHLRPMPRQRARHHQAVPDLSRPGRRSSRCASSR